MQERHSFKGKPLNALIPIPSRSQPFKVLLEKMSRKLHQANQEKLETLQRVQQNMVVLLTPENFFKLRFTNRYATAAMLGTETLETSIIMPGDIA